MDKQELELYFIEFLEEYNSIGAKKVFEKLYKIHRGNLMHIIREWREEIDKLRINLQSQS